MTTQNAQTGLVASEGSLPASDAAGERLAELLDPGSD